MRTIQKFIFSLVALFFAFSISSFAQGQKKHHNHEQKLERMKAELGLSDSQAEQIKILYQSKRQETKGLRQEAKQGNEESRAKLKANRAELKAEVDKILTPEQRKKAKALRAEHKNPENRAERRVEKWKLDLSLTNAQTEKVKAALVTKITKIQFLKEAAGNEKVDKTKRKAIKTIFETELKSILSNEQFDKYEELKVERKAKHSKKEQPKRGIKENNSPMKH